MAAKERHVLWVEDENDPDLVKAVQGEMNREVDGYIFALLRQAETPDEACEYFSKYGHRVDLILMDCVWENFNTDGVELVHRLVASYERPVVYLTGQFAIASTELKNEISNRPAWLVVTKGFEDGELGLAMARATHIFTQLNSAALVGQAASATSTVV